MSTATLAAPITLADQILHHQQELREQGWTCFREAMTPAQLVAGREAIDALTAKGLGVQANEQHYHAPNLVARAAVFREITEQPLVLATAESLVGPDCILSSCNLGTRRPGGDRQSVHRDTSIWGPSMPFFSVPVGIQTAWCFDDFTIDNGATHVIPGSHARADASHEEPTIQLTAPAGSILAFDSQLFHAGGANRTAHLRRAVLTLYIRSWLKPQTDHKRSFPPELIATSSPALLRLLGFQRQSPVERPDGRTEIIMAPGATLFYGQPPSDTASTY